MKKIFKTLLATAFVLALVCAPALAQIPASDAELEATLKKEPPLTEKDIDTFLKLVPQVEASGQDFEAIEKIAQGAGLSLDRLGFILGKVSIGVMLLNGMTKESLGNQFPEALYPTEAELALITKRQEELVTAMSPK